RRRVRTSVGTEKTSLRTAPGEALAPHYRTRVRFPPAPLLHSTTKASSPAQTCRLRGLRRVLRRGAAPAPRPVGRGAGSTAHQTRTERRPPWPSDFVATARVRRGCARERPRSGSRSVAGPAQPMPELVAAAVGIDVDIGTAAHVLLFGEARDVVGGGAHPAVVHRDRGGVAGEGDRQAARGLEAAESGLDH